MAGRTSEVHGLIVADPKPRLSLRATRCIARNQASASITRQSLIDAVYYRRISFLVCLASRRSWISTVDLPDDSLFFSLHATRRQWDRTFVGGWW
jgi:hypothetical protein